MHAILKITKNLISMHTLSIKLSKNMLVYLHHCSYLFTWIYMNKENLTCSFGDFGE